MKYDTEINIQKVVDFVKQHSMDTRIYIGTDSEKHRDGRVWMADYISVVVVHIDGKHGCKIFGCVKREKVIDTDQGRPIHRMMAETYKSAELYQKVYDALVKENDERALSIEIHLDINSLEEHASSLVVDQAVGYIKGVCGIEPQIKPDAFSASYAADRWKEIAGLKPSDSIQRITEASKGKA